jgi:hypothetical protein
MDWAAQLTLLCRRPIGPQPEENDPPLIKTIEKAAKSGKKHKRSKVSQQPCV